jgi:DNA-binding CsgD family transcriptional regulator
MLKKRHAYYNSKRPVVTEGDAPTDKELQVWELVSRGLANKEIAYQLSISESTVKVNIGSLLTKLGVLNRVHLALLWHGIEIGEKKERVLTDRDLREMVARDCFEKYKGQMGIRSSWATLPESRKAEWRKNVTMGVTVNGRMLQPRDGT